MVLYDTLPEEVEMSTYCRTCGRPIKGEGTICEACKENIRAEAMGRQRKIAKQAPTKLGKPNIYETKEHEDTQALTPPQDEEDKKPHHFKSMAEYLEYIKEKEGK
jgi:hypothetical protein